MKSIPLPELSRDAVNEVLTSLVAPRPIAWVSTVSSRNGDAQQNLAPFSAFAPICNEPPMLAFSCQRRPDGTPKQTAQNILATREFVVNLLERDQVSVMVETAAEPDGRGTRKWPPGIVSLPSKKVLPPRVGSCRVALECVLASYQELGCQEFVGGHLPTADLLIGRIVTAWVAEELVDPQTGLIVPHQFRPVAALDIDWYSDGEKFEKKPNLPLGERPPWLSKA
jgi:flavin reductase (DIM6/NTAB) family NADH-FMN oxidoreductase RutF